MTVKRGQDWGEPGPLAEQAPVFSGDRAAAAFCKDHLTQLCDPDSGPVELGLLSGDLHQSLGSPGHSETQLRGGDSMRFHVDLGLVSGVRSDGSRLEDCFLAHLVAIERSLMRALFSTRTVVVMNATHRGEYDLGPRAHPNDGVLDVTDGQLPGSDRLRARKRMRTGSHLPHPMLATSRGAAFEFRFSRPAGLELDGHAIGQVKELGVRCVPDALVVVA